jgi:GMP synthase (glutamine-hydrolysing)
MEDRKRKIFGLQFHVEVTHSQHGMTMLKNFVGLCDHAPWKIDNFVEHVSGQIKEEVRDRNVFMLVSGGVDSSVAFTLLNKVLGPDRVQGLLVDTGLMRKNEVKLIADAFKKLGIKNLHVEDASEEFFTALEGLYDPEAKRKAIGETFLAVQKRVSEHMGLKIEDGWMLGQGTIYPDTIETGGTKHADHIKTHHNRVDAVQKLIDAGLVIEPLKELYKDEVRKLGEELGLPKELVERHPFPGPGLGVRILCGASAPRPALDAETEAVLQRVIGSHVHAELPIKSVGVQGDGRTYRHALALFSHHSCKVTPEQIALATTIPNAVRAYSRVVLCTSHNQPPTFVFSPGALTRDRADMLREADAIVNEEMHKASLYESIWQFPVVLLPFGLMHGGQSIVLRPIRSENAMTADAVPLGEAVLQKMTDRLMSLAGIEAVFLDLTNKPPGTIEWE